MKIVTINLHGDTNMAAAYLHSLIEKAGYDITTINFRRLPLEFKPIPKIELLTLKKVINNINPDVILMSVNSISFWNAIQITQEFKNRTFIWGGVQPMVDPEACLKYVNIIVRGEGDEAILDILDAIENHKKIDKIKNVWFRKGNKIIKNDFRELVRNLDSLPFPDYGDKNKLYIMGNQVFSKNPLPHYKYEYNVSFSRGCPFSCKYCFNHLLNKEFKHKYLRRRSVDSALGELILAKKLFPKLAQINFWDDVFMMDLNWLRDFVKKYKKYIRVPFFAYGNANFITEERMKLLQSAGLKFFDLGLQSGSERIRMDIFGRIDSNKQILQADAIIHKLGIEVGYDIITSEFENEADIEESINFVLKLKKPFKVNTNKLAYYPNFEITQLALKKKKITEDNIAGINPKIRTQLLTKEETDKNVMTNYYYLLGYRLIPNSFIKYMLKNKWHKKHSKFIINFAAAVNKIEQSKFPLINIFKMLGRGEFKYLYNRIFNRKYYPTS